MQVDAGWGGDWDELLLDGLEGRCGVVLVQRVSGIILLVQ